MRIHKIESCRQAWLLLVAIGCLAGCSRSAPSAGTGGPASSPGTAATAATTLAGEQWPSPSDDECRAFASQFEQAVAASDVDAINALIDWDSLLLRCVREEGPLSEETKNFIAGAKKSIGSPTGLAGQLAQANSEGGNYRLLRVRSRDGRKTALFRLVHPSSGVNYHEYLMAREGDGNVRAIDVYTFLAAEYMSSTLRRWYLPLAAHQNRSFLERLTGQESEFVQHVNEIDRLTKCLQARQSAEMLQIYRSLPASLQQDKSVLLLRIQAAAQEGDAEYRQAIEDFLRYHPDDPCVDLLSIDFYTLRKEYDKALACIDRIEKAVEGDAYQVFLRGATHLVQGDTAKAREFFQASMEADTTLLDPVQGLAQLCANEKDFAGVIHWFEELERNYQFQISCPDLEALPEYAEFVKSAEYQAWKAARQ